MTCYVIDDEFHAVEVLEDLIKTTPGLTLVGHSTNPLEGMEYLTSHGPVDLTFADINMPTLSGIELAALVNSVTTVILTTAHANYAVEAYEKEVFDYLLKPITRERFLKTIARFKRERSAPAKTDDHFYVKADTKGKMHKISIPSITYIEGALNYVIIHSEDGKSTITYLTMSELEAHLPQNHFTRMHKSYIVNTDKIKSLDGSTLILQDGTFLSIGGTYKDQLFAMVEKRTIKSKRSS